MPNQIIQSHGGQLCKDHSDTTFAKSLYHQVRTPYLSNLELDFDWVPGYCGIYIPAVSTMILIKIS